MNLDLSKTSGPVCIPVVVLKNCEPELSYKLFYCQKFLREENLIPANIKIICQLQNLFP